MRRAASTTQPLCGPQVNYQRLCRRALFLAVTLDSPSLTIHFSTNVSRERAGHYASQECAY
ncbi:hypothetical protein BGW80DRAFT_1413952 [Lactifluus volemus]|nr:hypothetical protein BGW80DRAFT_1413952 [Lactifluus volemus]